MLGRFLALLLVVMLGHGTMVCTSADEYYWDEPEYWGDEDDETVTFDTPWVQIAGTNLERVTDCVTGEEIPATEIYVQYVGSEGQTEPSFEELDHIVIGADGYEPIVVPRGEFSTVTINLGFLTFIVIAFSNPTPCLAPAEGCGGCGIILLNPPLPGPLPVVQPPPTPPPAECGAKEERWGRICRLAQVIDTTAQCTTKPNGGHITVIETTYSFKEYQEYQVRGPCELDSGHTGSHSPWSWSAPAMVLRSETQATGRAVIGGCPARISESKATSIIAQTAFDTARQMFPSWNVPADASGARACPDPCDFRDYGPWRCPDYLLNRLNNQLGP